jgi:selenocysteine-specific elongation factor
MYVIGTAGHVDHGKSTLVKTLTGIDPDRWEEEQRRQMTIDLGFAWLTLPSGRTVSVIDVPGHERFIKNMLAGIGGIDAALLVIAADESVMPQTEEHLAILELLDVRHGVVALTKADLVDADWLDLVRDDVATLLKPTPLAGAALVPVSARSGAGLPQLLAALDSALAATPSRTEAQGAPRLPIDRAFTIGGFGAVVTGTLIDGPLRLGDELEIQPAGLRARVRGLQTHQRKEEIALPGTRVAVNLAGVSHHDLARGYVLALPGQLQPTTLLDAQLRTTATGRPVHQNDRVELFVGASEVACRVTLLDSDELAPGETGWVQLRLEAPIAVARGARYIVRLASPSMTIGGGRIVATQPARHRRFRPDVTSGLAALARGAPADLVQQALKDGLPHRVDELGRTTALPADVVGAGAHELLAAGAVLALGAGSGWLISQFGWDALRAKATGAIAGYHRRYPLRGGIPREELRSRVKLAAEPFEALLAGLAERQALVLLGARVAAPDFQPHLQPDQERAAGRFVQACLAAPYSPPAPEIDDELLAFLVDSGQLVRVAPDVVFPGNAYQTMVAWVRAAIRQHGSVTVAQFRDQFGSSRKYALALLEHLDDQKITRRVGDARVLHASGISS